MTCASPAGHPRRLLPGLRAGVIATSMAAAMLTGAAHAMGSITPADAARNTARGTAGSPRPPNVIYILADDLGYAELGAYGQTIIRTPNLDRMAAQGMRFTDHYAGNAICAPSRAALQTGLDMAHAPIRDNHEMGGYTDATEGGQQPMPEHTFTIGRLMQQAGYRTALIGKWGLGGYGKSDPTSQGYDYYFGYLDQKQAHNYYPTHLWEDTHRYPLDNRPFSAHQGFPRDEDPNDPRNYDKYKGKFYSVDAMADKVDRFIRDNAKRPFFLVFAPTLPHSALQVPDKWVHQYDRIIKNDPPYLSYGPGHYLPAYRPHSTYAGMISRLDDSVGQILSELKRLHLDDNTIVMFSSDNGASPESGSPRTFFHSEGPLRGGKGILWEGGIREPLIVRWPGHVPAGRVSHLVSAQWDLLPTLAELTGQASTPQTDGVSLLPTLLNHPQQQAHPPLYWELFDVNNGYGKPEIRGMQAVRIGPWKGVRLNASDDPDAPLQLYNLHTDIGEMHDVAAAHPDIVARMRKVMDQRVTVQPYWDFRARAEQPGHLPSETSKNRNHSN